MSSSPVTFVWFGRGQSGTVVVPPEHAAHVRAFSDGYVHGLRGPRRPGALFKQLNFGRRNFFYVWPDGADIRGIPYEFRKDDETALAWAAGYCAARGSS